MLFSRHHYQKLCIQYLQQLYMIITFRDEEEKAQSVKAISRVQILKVVELELEPRKITWRCALDHKLRGSSLRDSTSLLYE